MKKQRGLSLIGYIVLVSLCALLAVKLFPAYTEYFMIQRIFKALVVDPGLKDVKALRRAFERFAEIDNITGIKADDIEVSSTAISAQYSVKVPLIANVNLLLEFNPSTAAN
jgi:Tfp pilus assembly protein PilE